MTTLLDYAILIICVCDHACMWLPELSIGDGEPTEGKSHTEGNGVTEGD